jgi:hypothetical protein
VQQFHVIARHAQVGHEFERSERSGEAVEFAMLVWFGRTEAEDEVRQGACIGRTRHYLRTSTRLNFTKPPPIPKVNMPSIF